jgi:hypothetical protein
MPRLRTAQGHILALPPRRVSLGESPGCDVPIAPGHGMAGVHLYLQPWESGYFLEDAASGLGTLVNGTPVTWAPLKHGDMVTAGGLTLLYEEECGDPLPIFRAGPPLLADSGSVARPPAWLPAEALLPPLSPVAQAALKSNAASKPKGRKLRGSLCLLAFAAGAGGVWWFLRHR